MEDGKEGTNKGKCIRRFTTRMSFLQRAKKKSLLDVYSTDLVYLDDQNRAHAIN